MKRLLLILVATALLTTGGIAAYGQTGFFQGAIIPTHTYPDDDTPFRAFFTSCYSYGNIPIGGSLSDLYIFTWNDLGSHDLGASGIALRQFISGSQISQTYTTWGTEIIKSDEAVLLKQGQDVFVLAAYYSVDLQGFYVDLYKYVSGALVQQSGYPVNITTTGTASFDQIRVDAHTLNNFIITWEEQGKILTRAGAMVPGGISLGNTVTLNNAAIGMPKCSQPDVALVESQQSGLRVHFVYTNTQQSRLMVSSLDFNSILNAPPSSLLTPTVEDIQGTSGIFELPRIDAPDNFPTDDWSYVVMNSNPTAQTNKVFTGISASGTLHHFNLNDGSLPGSNIPPDISSTSASDYHINRYPVVAYDNTGHNLYYCWYYFSNVDMPTTTSSKAYIGLKISNTGTLLSISNKYCIVQQQPEYTSDATAIALSGQNDASPDLFMSFTQYNVNSSAAYSIGSKMVPWNNTQFRPNGQDTSTDVASISLKDKLEVYPNPFSNTFQFRINGEDVHKHYYLVLTNLSGQKVLTAKGTLSELNRDLAADGKLERLPAGLYGLSIGAGHEQACSFKLLKIIE